MFAYDHPILFGLLVLYASIMLCYIVPRLGHAVFGWHHVDSVDGFDGCSLKGRCTICKKDCLMDSQGNWF